MIAEMHNEKYFGIKPSPKKPEKSCDSCKYSEGAICTHKTPGYCSHYELWEAKAKPSGRPKKPVKAGKVQ
jgi:hypothetical protein